MAQLTNMKLVKKLSDESYQKKDGTSITCSRLLFQEQGSNYSKEFLTKWYGKSREVANVMSEGEIYTLSVNLETIFSNEKDYNKITCFAAQQTSSQAQRIAQVSTPMAMPNGDDDLPF